MLREILEKSAAMMPPAPEGYGYNSLYDYVVVCGVEFQSAPLTKEEMQVVTKAMGRRTWRQRECFMNAQELALSDDRLVYHEGYAIGNVGLPILHAWVAINGKVVDVTWRPEVFGETTWLYLGVPFTPEQIRVHALKTGFWASLIDDWQNDYPLIREPRRCA